MSESKIPWPIWAAVMLACAVIAAWASRPQTDDQRVEYLQRKISSLEAQLNRQQPTYSPSVSEPSPSPKAIPAPTPTITTEPTPNLSNPKSDHSVFNSDVKTSPEPTPTSTPTPEPLPTSDPRDPLPFPANDIKSPQWSYEVFNSNSDSGSSRLIGKPNFDQQKREVEWLVEYSTISRSNNETSPKSPLDKINKDLELLLVQQEIEGIGFFAEFKYSNGVSLGKAKLNREGTGNRIRYSLRISDNIWQKWSEISQVIIE
jgi:hypothetical protein